MSPTRPRVSSRIVHAWATGVLCLLASGCSEDPASRLASISGVVTMDGRPMVGALVEFEPVPGRAGDPSFNPSSTGTTDADGRFRLDTPFGSGAVAGEHTVKIWEAVEVESEEELPADEQLELKLLPEFRTKGRPFTVSDEGTKEADFALQSAPATTSQTGDRRPGASGPSVDASPPAPTTTRAYQEPISWSARWMPRVLGGVVTIALWLLALAGCFKWWKHNERRLLERI